MSYHWIKQQGLLSFKAVKARKWHRTKAMGFVSLYDKLQHIPKGVYFCLGRKGSTLAICSRNRLGWRSADSNWQTHAPCWEVSPMECSVGQKEWWRYFSYILFSVKTFSNINLLCVGGRRRQLIELEWLSFHERVPQKEVLVLTTILLAFFDLKKKNQIPVYISERIVLWTKARVKSHHTGLCYNREKHL